MPRSPFSALALALLGCASGCARPTAHDQPVRLASTAAPTSCAEWVHRAVAKPDLDVERVPTPLAYDPPPIPRRLPPNAGGRSGRPEVRIQVIVDTLGRADMKSFRVVRSTHPQLTASVRNAVSRWRFQPAEVSGCKVPRLFNWGAVAAPSGQRG